MEGAMMRAKLRVTDVKAYGEPVTSETISFMAVTGKATFGPEGESEDNTYARYTPWASLSMTINNPSLLGKLQRGDTFYVDFTKTE